MPYEPPLFSSRVMPGINLDKALELAAQLDDEDLVTELTSPGSDS